MSKYFRMSVAVEVNGGQPQFFNKPASGISTLSIFAPVGTDDFVNRTSKPRPMGRLGLWATRLRRLR